MKTAAQILREKRKEKGLTLEKIARETKIPLRYLKLIEAARYDYLPDESYTRLYIRDYASYLGLSADEVISFFQRDLSVFYPSTSRQQSSSLKKRVRRRLSFFSRWLIGPNAIRWGGGVVVFFLLGIYLVRQYLVFNSPPEAKIDFFCQREGEEKWLEVKGKTNKEAVVKIEGIPVVVDDEGRFKERVLVLPEQKTVEIFLESPTGRSRRIEKEIDCFSSP